MFPAEIVNYNNGLVQYGMGKTSPRRQLKVYLAEWIVALGRTRKEVADHADITVSYIANMKRGARLNVRGELLFTIAEFLGITIDDLYHPPPPGQAINAMVGLSSQAREALMRVSPKKQKKTT